MLVESGSCFVFAVGIYGSEARFFRFDRSGAIASTSFSWATRATILPKFFWRLCHPKLPKARITGSDPTISIPSPREKRMMHKKFRKITGGTANSFEVDTAHSLWIEARLEDNIVRCFTVGPPIFPSTELFGRTTHVEKVLLEQEDEPKLYALKDSWAQLDRRPESEFYHIVHASSDDPVPGVAQCKGSYNLHEDRRLGFC
ncbi:hypothetical protein B0H10DRAFT_764717 [Mycena sp. CBHHK59/15]|nr:hypothetical protein B0H10DRAFT_764717 [Mycena sp. CBHHK59/15]